MGEVTGISWCDHTFNPWWGCTRVSPGCVNCYAETFDRRTGGDHWGPGKPRREFGDKHWREPLKWDAQHRKEGTIGKVFCASMADIFDEEVPEAWRQRLWGLVRQTNNLVWQFLTKRVNGYWDMPGDIMCSGHVWKGFTAEDQERYDERWNEMRRWPGIVWVSYEPAIGPLTSFRTVAKPRWFVFGGESGPHRRPCEESWAANLLRECREYGIPFFMKQMSAATPAKGKALIPEHLRVQEFPA